MKKNSKILTLALSAALLLQASPMGVFGDDAWSDADVHIIDANDPAPIDDADAITVDLIQWQSLAGGGRYTVLRQDSVMTSNHVRMRLILSGDPTDMTVTINGEEVVYELMGSIVMFTAGLMSGQHTMTVTTHNGETAESMTVNFRVAGDSSYPALEIETPGDLATGQPRAFTVTGNHLENVDTLTVKVAMTRGFDVADIRLADGVTGTYMYFRGTLTLYLTIEDHTRITDGALATVQIQAPDTLPEDSTLTWEVIDTEVTVKDPMGDDFISRLDPADTIIGVETRYTVSGDTEGIAGLPVTVLVTDTADAPVAGVALFAMDGTLLGLTDAEGRLSTTYFTDKGVCRLYARDDAGATSRPYAFINYVSAGDASGTPYGIRFGAFSEGTRTVSWLGHCAGTSALARVQIATDADMTDALTVTGSATTVSYTESFTASRAFTATLSDLQPGTTYYCRVGDGTVWSEVVSFSVPEADETTELVILGNMIADKFTRGQLVESMIACDRDFDAVLWTGTLLQDHRDYAGVETYLQTVNALPFVNVGAGYTGSVYTVDQSAPAYAVTGALTGIDGAGDSYEIEHVHLATLHYTADAAELAAAVEAIVAAAEASDAAWRVLSVGRSPMGGDADFADVVESLAARAGFDVVLSASDAGYTRTEAQGSGATYISLGSVGGAVTVDDTVTYASTLSEYNALYITASATASSLTLEVMHAKDNGRTEVADRLALTH